MNAVTQSELKALDLVDIVDFKWLMAGAGHKVHVEQMQCDRAYAQACLMLGAVAPVPALRQCARQLALRHGFVLPAAS